MIFLSSNKHNYLLNVAIYNDSTLFFGSNNYINGQLNLILSEGKNIFIGNDCLFSFGIWMRLADPHLIYDSNTKCRINPSKSIFIGDHVWIGQNALLLKGTQIGSGSILGAMSLLSGKKVPSNTTWRGVPAKQVSRGIFWRRNCVHSYKPEDTKKVQIYDSDEFIFSENFGEQVDMDEFERTLQDLEVAEVRLGFVKEKLQTAYFKNRFYIGNQKDEIAGRYSTNERKNN